MQEKETKEIKEEKGYECICRGDPRVVVLLGKQQPPQEGKKLRRSCFAYPLYEKGKYLLFHTLTRELLLLAPKDISYFADGRVQENNLEGDELQKKLYEHFFLVPEDAQESSTYLELKDILVVKEELPKDITHYVILPTTTCNARCFYCFEQGMKYHKMSKATVEDTVRFIQSHSPRDKKQIHIHWFGGEPMCAPENIDRICEALKESGLEYTAEMTSNGSLFTEESAKKAAKKWNVRKIQITLDGMAEEYEKRKNYSKAVKHPFETVIRNIHILLKAGIRVIVRLNADENNLGEIYKVIDFLQNEFTTREKKKLQVYAHSLFGQGADGLDACPVGSGSDLLEQRVLEINDYIYRAGLAMRDLGQLFSLKSHYCMVTAPQCNVLIDAAGNLFACDAMPENMKYGNVETGIDPQAWKKVAAPCPVRRECEGCVFLPQCTEFDRCPNRTPYDACRRQEERKLAGELRFAYALWLENKKKKKRAKKQDETTPPQQEAEHVPD